MSVGFAKNVRFSDNLDRHSNPGLSLFGHLLWTGNLCRSLWPTIIMTSFPTVCLFIKNGNTRPQMIIKISSKIYKWDAYNKIEWHKRLTSEDKRIFTYDIFLHFQPFRRYSLFQLRVTSCIIKCTKTNLVMINAA